MNKMLDFSGDIIGMQIEEMKNAKIPVVMFGFGGSVFRMYDYLKNKAGLDIRYIVDNNPQKWGSIWEGAEVISFTKLKEIYQDCNIIISVSSYKYVDEIKNQIVKDGQYSDKRVFYFELYYPFGNDARTIIENFLEDIKKVENILSDELSKECFINKINYILTKRKDYIAPNTDAREYFPTDIMTFAQENFIDAGAFHGEDTLALMDFATCIKAYCVEPDAINYSFLKENIKKYSNIEIINAAVWNKSEELSFAASGTMGSTVNKGGTVKVKGISLDKEIGINNNITFIKMDVEGAELEALEGAKNIIKKNKPKLAICVYHTIEHHWQIPLFIHSLCPEYKIYMRQHDQTGIETVCYATL